MQGQVGFMESAAYFVALVLFFLGGLVVNRLIISREGRHTVAKAVQAVKDQLDKPDTAIGGKIAEVKRETNVQAQQTAQDWFAEVGRKQLEAMEKRNSDLEKTVNGFVDRLDEVEKERDAIGKRLTDVETALEAEKLAAVKRKDEYNTRITNLENERTAQVASLQGKVDELTTRVNRLETENATLKQERDDARTNLEKANEKIEEQDKRIIKLETREETLMLLFSKIPALNIAPLPDTATQTLPQVAPPIDLDKASGL